MSMNRHIKAVKDNIQQLRDKLEEEYKKCDVVFSFVRYTDYSGSDDRRPVSTRTSYLQFTRSVKTLTPII